MKKLFIFLVVAGAMACNCIGQLPIQVLPVDSNCVAILPDYRDHITVRANCGVESVIQFPIPGTVMDASNPYLNVTIVATGTTKKATSMEFDVVIDDPDPPVIELDSSFWFAYEPVDRSPLLRAYHTLVGLDMHAAAQGPDSIFTHSLLRDTSYWEPNPWLDADSTFDSKGMMVRWDPGFGATSVGSFIDSDRYVLANIDSNHLKTLDMWPLMEVKIGTVTTPLTIDVAGSNDNREWLTQEYGGPVYKYVEAPAGLAEMYKSERWGIFSYKIPTGPGTFVVELHFAETYFDNIGDRIFDVNLQGDRVMTDFDILAVRNKWEPITKMFTVQVGWQGFLEIDFPVARENYGKLSGITIRRINGLEANLSSIN